MGERYKEYSHSGGIRTWMREGLLWRAMKARCKVGGNKLYSEETCVFVPQQVNKFFTHDKTTKGEYPTGVSWHTSAQLYQARCSGTGGVELDLGRYLTVEEAVHAYKTTKATLARSLAVKFKGQVDVRVYTSLLDYVF